MIRRLKPQAEVADKRRKNQIIAGVIMIVLMLFSTAGYAFLNNKSEDSGSGVQKYGQYRFARYGEEWNLNMAGQNFYFQYLPGETENVSISGSYSLANYSNKPLYFVNSNGATQEILANIGQYVLRYQEACLSGTNCTNLPIKSCDDNLIVFVDSNENKVYSDKNCVYISGEYIKTADAFIYRLFGIK